MNQCKRILAYMIANGNITARDAVNDLDCYRLSARIKDLRDEGYKIVTDRVCYKNRFGDYKQYAVYSLEQKNE